MVVNFRIRRISRGIRKLVRTPISIKKKKEKEGRHQGVQRRLIELFTPHPMWLL